MATSARAGRLLGQFWLYTLLRVGLFGAVWGVLWVVNVRGMLGLLIAVLLSVPLSFVLLARPRAALAESLEQRVSERKVREDDLRLRLAGEPEEADDIGEPGEPEAEDGTALGATPASAPRSEREDRP
ncbi:MAG: hypothetical protein JWN20_1305 [Jatrophihabitantaceae bacterium]|nr:hypothetical protein [Jatrophihabitantaceae bacterium]